MDNAIRMPNVLSSDDQQSLRGLVPLHTLPADVLEKLLEHVVVETVKPGEMLFNQGDTDHENVYLISGRVVLLNKGSVVERVESGTETARFPLAHQLPRKFSVRAEVTSRVTRIDSRLLSDFLARSRTEDYQVADLEDASEDDWMSLLLQSRVLQQVPASNIQRVMMSVEQQEVAKGDDLIRQGDPGDYYYMLTRGRAVVRRDNGDGKGPVELATLGPGDAFGEEALLSDNPRNSSVTMLHDGHVLRLSKDNFLQLIHDPLLVQVDMGAAQERIDDGAIWLDLRSGEAYDESHREGAINLPFESLRYQTSSLAPDHHYVIYSDTTARAMAGAFLLTERGFDVSVLNQPYQGADETPVADQPVDADDPPRGGEVHSEIQQRAHQAEKRAQLLEEQLESARREREAVDAERAQHLAQVRGAVDLAKRKLIETEGQKREALEAQRQAYSDMEKLTGNLESLQNERASLVERMSEIEGLDKQLQARLAKAERELIGERERAESAAHSLEELTQRFHDEIARREQEGHEHARERGELKEELTALQLDLEQANLDLDELREALAAHDSEQGDASQALAAVEESLQQEREANLALDNERNALRERIEVLQQQLDSANQERAGTEEQAQASRALLEEQLEAVRGELADLRVQHADGLQAAEQQSQQAREAVERLQQQLDGLVAERDALQQQVDDAGRSRQGDQEARQQAEQFGQQLAAERDALQRELDAARNDSEAVRAELERLQLAASEADAASAARVQQLNDTLRELREQHARLQTELAAGDREAGDAIAQAQARASELEEQLAARDRDVAQHEEDHRVAIDAARQEQAAQAEALEAARRSAGELSAELEGLRDAQAAAQASIAELEESLAAAREQNDREHVEQADAVAARDARIADLEASLAAESDALRSVREEHDAMVAAIDTERAEHADARARLEAERDEMNQAREAAGEAAAGVGAELDALRARIADLEGSVEGLRIERDQALGGFDEVSARLEASLSELEQLRGENTRLGGVLESAGQANDDSIATLRSEIAELAQRLEEREMALAGARAEQAELIEALNAASAERDTLQLSLNDQDSGLARVDDLENQLAEAQRAQQREMLRNEQQVRVLEEQVEQQRAKRKALEEEVERLTQMVEEDAQTDAGDVRAERDELQAELALRESEVEQLRSVLEEYVDQIRAAQSGDTDISEVEALRTELEMVREQAVRDVAHMREQLAVAERQQRRLQEADGREAVSHEAMRQKIEELEAIVAERQRDIAQAEAERHAVEDELEDANAALDALRIEIEQHREDADQAMMARREAETAREQLQAAFTQQQANADEARGKDMRDDRLRVSHKPLGIDSVSGPGRVLPGLVGAAVVIAVLEAISLASGKGEFFTLLLSLLRS